MGDVLLKRQWSFSGKLTRLILVGGKPGFVSDGGLFKESTRISQGLFTEKANY
ncbi:hypothetical protein [Klebsiella pneumoniae]|uniref:hypothetical protein n=1 Tax=Klebsiella pneumoniae TaxID=573 RepID=UPI0025A4434B|nr:hypothetical protein [Klebsiella pneumoniae]MDM8094366.1 hypothetical protein [Klebsiella pneumoniae]